MFAANTIIENLLQRKAAQAAMVLDALFVSDAIQLASIEISSILHYFKLCGIGIAESTVRRGLFDLARLKVFGTFKVMNRRKGRPLWNYVPKSEAEMAQILGVKLHRDENRDSVPFSAFKSTAAYRGDKHYGLLVRLGRSELSRKKLGARLGVGGRSTYNYELGKKLTVIHRVETTPLSMKDIAFAPEKRLNQNVFLEVHVERDMTDAEMMQVYKGFDESILLVGRRKTTDKKYMPYTAFFLRRELERGNDVYLSKQITNEYSIPI